MFVSFVIRPVEHIGVKSSVFSAELKGKIAVHSNGQLIQLIIVRTSLKVDGLLHICVFITRIYFQARVNVVKTNSNEHAKQRIKTDERNRRRKKTERNSAFVEFVAAFVVGQRLCGRKEIQVVNKALTIIIHAELHLVRTVSTVVSSLSTN